MPAEPAVAVRHPRDRLPCVAVDAELGVPVERTEREVVLVLPSADRVLLLRAAAAAAAVVVVVVVVRQIREWGRFFFRREGMETETFWK